MGHVESAERLSRQGKFAEALRLLDGSVTSPDERLAVDVLRAELLERTGRYDESKTLAERLLRNPRCLPIQKSACLLALGYCAFEHGFIESATNFFQKALSAAEAAGDLRAVCSCQLRLMNLVADRSGHQAMAPLLAQVRRNVTRLGDTVTTAALHISIGELEAKRGFATNALRHTSLGQNLLRKEQNIYLEGVSENSLMAVSIMKCDHLNGIEHGQHALRLAVESGSNSLRRAAIGNLGNLYLLTGQFDMARQYLDSALQVFPTTGTLSNGAIESLALLSLAEGRIEDAESLLARMRSAVKTQADWMIYANRHSRLTFVEVMSRRGRRQDALIEVEQVIDLAERSGDRQLRIKALLTKAELLIALERLDPAIAILNDTITSLPDYPPDLYAKHQRAMALAYSGLHQASVATRAFQRSRRVYRALHNVCGELELERVWAEVPKRGNVETAACLAGAESLLQSMAALLLHARRPTLVAMGLVSILEDVGVPLSATALTRSANGSTQDLSSFDSGGSTESNTIKRVFVIGEESGASIELHMRTSSKLESIGVVNAVTLLLRTVHDLEQAHREREERLTLWPLDERSDNAVESVVLGRFSEVMSDARRVAATSVNILITGESGTGKEILARAIHSYSTRADKPFVPFNCAAVPREMLESQLFGHRRGAFTGADRDSPGVIRAASHGTLLLDEIGELSPELQPKLLRFLESGEISPLGDPQPTTIDVRVIAATNANLEQLVQDGRFREDLFYRLNVIRLTLPPLRERRDEIPALVHHFVARAAQEFGKTAIRVAEETMELLIVFSWPGNVRQLNNELRRMVALAESDSTLTPSALSKEILHATPRAARGNAAQEIALPLTEKLQTTLSRVEREMIKAALKTSDGRVDAAARALGISRKGLYLKRQRLGL